MAAIEQDSLRIYNDIASNFASSEFVYLLKGPDTEVTADNFHTSVQAGSVLGELLFIISSLTEHHHDSLAQR